VERLCFPRLCLEPEILSCGKMSMGVSTLTEIHSVVDLCSGSFVRTVRLFRTNPFR